MVQNVFKFCLAGICVVGTAMSVLMEELRLSLHLEQPSSSGMDKGHSHQVNYL